MKYKCLVALLGAIALGPVSHAQIKVAVRCRDWDPSVPAIEIPNVVSGPNNDVLVSARQMRDAMLTAGLSFQFDGCTVMWVFDNVTRTPAPQDPQPPQLSIGSITITASLTPANDPVLIPNMRLLIAPAPLAPPC